MSPKPIIAPATWQPVAVGSQGAIAGEWRGTNDLFARTSPVRGWGGDGKDGAGLRGPDPSHPVGLPQNQIQPFAEPNDSLCGAGPVNRPITHNRRCTDPGTIH